MKILKGTLRETRYACPKVTGSALSVIKETTYQENQVTYMSDELGLHKITNPDPNDCAISLHRKCSTPCDSIELSLSAFLVYTPPNARIEGCHIFNEQTGKQSHVTQSEFYSEFGRRLEK